MVCYKKKLQWNTFEVFAGGPQLQECNMSLFDTAIASILFGTEGMSVINYHNLHQLLKLCVGLEFVYKSSGIGLVMYMYVLRGFVLQAILFLFYFFFLGGGLLNQTNVLKLIFG